MDQPQSNNYFNTILVWVAVLLILILVGMWVVDAYPAEVKVAVMVILTAISTVVVVFALYIVFLLIERILAIRARRRAVEKEADLYVIDSEANGLVIGARSHDWNWTMASLAASGRWNGSLPAPSPDEQRRWEIWTGRNSSTHALPAPAYEAPQIGPGGQDLLSAVLKFDRMMLIGGSGSGKTSLMQHIVANKAGEIVVVDPDDDGSTWPSNARVVGGGENFESIRSELGGFIGEKSHRYQFRSQGQKDFSALFMVLEEWYKIIQHIDGGRYLKEMLVSLRKVNMGVLVISQSDRAAALGLSGNFDLMSSFEAIVRLSGTKDTGISATIDTGSGPIAALHPGPFRGQIATDRPERSYSIDANEPVTANNDGEILRLFAEGCKPWKIGQILHGSKGGWQTADVEEVLRKYGKI